MRTPLKMRNGRHFTHKPRESAGHTSQHIYLLLRDTDIHYIHIITAFFLYLNETAPVVLHA